MKDPDIVVRMPVKRILPKWKKRVGRTLKARQRRLALGGVLDVAKATPAVLAIGCGLLTVF